ncbi:50S ribosomal protein L23 [Rhynchospora pubera]|uniref:Large ribosomal subunit protein uL23m n=1 Tax=Rhynchospora pubera TaxID=906938 RepID=A0AAV8D1L9_9POAL|nr:50S ribosomal protein L23 [Rhynchospora pubera]
MGSRLGRRVVHFANLPIKLMLPSPPFDSIREFAIKTVPSASKIEIRRVLESLYGFDVAEVRTLNYEGKKLRRGYMYASHPDYKKAYVTLRSPLSISPELFPIQAVRESMEKKMPKSKSEVVESEEKRQHWLDERREEELSSAGAKKGYYNGHKRLYGAKENNGGQRKGKRDGRDEEKKSPRSGFKFWFTGRE